MSKDQTRRFLGMNSNALVLAVTEPVSQGILFLVSPFWSLYVLDIGASLETLGLLSFILGFTRIVLQIPIGYLTDMIGRKKLVVWGGLVSSFSPFIYFFATSWEHLIPGVILEAFTNIVLPARQAMFADSVEPNKRATAFAAIHTFFAAFSMTMPVLSGFILERIGFLSGMRIFFIISGLTMMLASVCRWQFLREGYVQQLGSNEEKSLYKVIQSMFDPIRKLKVLKVVLLGAFLYSLTVGILNQFSVVYATNVIGISTAQWGLVMGGIGFVGILTRLPIGYIIDRFGRKFSLQLSYIVRPFFIFFFTVASGFNQVLLIEMGDTLFSYMQQPALEAFIVDITSEENRGRTYGVMNIIPNMALMVSPMIGAALWKNIGAEWAFYFSAMTSIIAATVLFTFLRETEEIVK